MIHPTRILVMAAFSLLSAPAAESANAQKYKVIFLGTFGGDQTVATAINDLDDVVGYSQFSGNTGAESAFLYRNGKFINLDPKPIKPTSDARGINHYGQIVGSKEFLGATGLETHACLYKNGKILDLGTLPSSTGASGSFASAINDSGEIVGQSIANGGAFAFLYRNGIMTQLGTSGGAANQATAINNVGQIAGIGITPSGAFLYQNGSFTDLGTLGGSNSSALAINNLGQVVGWSTLSVSGEHAFLYENGVMKDLDPTSSLSRSLALGINDNGEVVGEATNANGIPLAFLYTTTKGLVKLNNNVVNLSNGTTIGFTNVASAHAINKNGDIVGVGLYFNGTKIIEAGFLLKLITK